MSLKKRISKQAIRVKARDWNDIVAAAAEAKQKQQGFSAPAFQASSRRFFVGKIRNNSGASVDRFQALALRDPIISPTDNLPEFQRQLAFEGYLPDSSDVSASPQRIGVLLLPLESGKIGDAALDGIVPCKVNILSTSDRFATLKASSTLLESTSTPTSAEIVWSEAGTGTKWALVRLGAGGSGASSTSVISVARVATTQNVNLSTDLENGDTIDGVTLQTGDIVLVRRQSTATENGLYEVNATGAPTRVAPFESGSSVAGLLVTVTEGNAYADTLFLVLNNQGSDVVGTDGLVIVPYPGFWAEITGKPSTPNGSYSWKEKYLSANGTFSDVTGGLTGTAGGNNEAWEANDNKSVPTGAIVFLHSPEFVSSTDIEWTFEYADKYETINLTPPDKSPQSPSTGLIIYLPPKPDGKCNHPHAKCHDDSSVCFVTVDTTEVTAWWRFENSTGDQPDYGPGGHTAVEQGQVLTVPGVVGKAANFGDATTPNGHYQVTHHADFNTNNGADKLYISFWIKVQDITGVGSGIVAKTGSWDFAWDSTNKKFQFGNGTYYATSNVVIEQDKWYFVEGQWDPATDKFGINVSPQESGGIQDNWQYSIATTLTDNTNNIIIGADYAIEYFKPLIDEVKFFKTILPDSQRKAQFNGGAGTDDNCIPIPKEKGGTDRKVEEDPNKNLIDILFPHNQEMMGGMEMMRA
ncbi:MAG: hypothetical protein KatS3mg105_3306 [Gemmatales bacterium]|nr:MAG: hypothetical protein KatS3mg105_3306 [Gemmatales bacterium]